MTTPQLVVAGMACAALVALIQNWRVVLGLLIAGVLWLIWGAIEIKQRIWR